LQILFLSKELSLAVCYSHTAQCHSIALLKPNLQEIANNQSVPCFESSIYDLGVGQDVADSALENSKPYIVAQRLFTDSGTEEKACRFEIIESDEEYRSSLSLDSGRYRRQFYLYVQVGGEHCYVKVYSLLYSLDPSSPHPFALSPVKKVRYIEDCRAIWSHKFLHNQHSLIEFQKHPSDLFRDENILLHKKDPLRNNLNVTNEAMEAESKKIEFPLYLNYQAHKYLMVEAEYKDAVIVQGKSGDYFRLFLGKECVFEFGLKDEFFKHKLLPKETCELKDIIDGVFRLECTHPLTGTKRYIYIDKAMPVIDDPFTITLLRVFLSVYDTKIYHTFIKDVIQNCLNFHSSFANTISIEIDELKKCNFKETNSDAYIRLTTYFAYLLSVDESTKQLMGQWEDLSYPVHTRLTDPLLGVSEQKKLRSQSQEPAAQPSIFGDQAWLILQKNAFFDPDLGEVADLFEETEFEEIPEETQTSGQKENVIRQVMPRVNLTMELFSQFKIKLFKYLHLLYEDLKLNVMMKPFVEKLGFFLYCYATFLNVGNVVNYIDYYARDNYRLPFEFASLESLQLIDKIVKRRTKPNSLSNFSSTYETEEKLFDLELLEEDPFDLSKSLSSMVAGKEIKRFPVLYHRSFFIYKIFLRYYGYKDDRCFKVFKRHFNMSEGLLDSVLPSTPVHRIYFSLDERAFLEQKLHNLVSRMNLRTKTSKPNEDIFLFMVDHKFRQSSLDTFGSGVRTVIESIIRDIRINLPGFIYNPCLAKGAYTLISREDIYMNILLYPKVKPIRNSNSSYLGPSFVERNTSMLSDRTSGDFYSNYSHLKEDKKESRPGEDFANKRMNAYLEKVNNIRFEENHLVFNEIQRILNISDLIRIKAKYIDHAQDDAEKLEYGYEAEAQVLLRKFAIRRLSVLVGRGAVTINTDRSLFTEVLSIPKITFNALIESTNRKISLEKKDENINWPEFHSGVSVGLKIPREIVEQKNKDTLRTWIDYQKTNYESFDKPGLIYALGLQGLLYCFLPTDIYLYLKPFYEPRSIGIMLGLAASKIGSRDENIMKAVAVHLACMLPEHTDLQLAMTVECAALLSIGLLYKGTCNKQFSQIMLKEILAKPNKEKNAERESYSLSAGFALGLINLGKGKNTHFKLDSSLDTELLRLVEGGKLPHKEAANKKCSNIKEGDFVNTQLVAPSALMALAFIYMKSENAQVASKISIPTFFYEVENCNPNHIVLKILAKNLILWSKITATDRFISDQIPPLVKMIVESRIEDIYDKCYSTFNVDEIDFSGITLIYYNIIAGCSLSLAMKYAGSGDSKAKAIIVDEIKRLRKVKVVKTDFCSDRTAKGRLELYNLFNLFSIHCLSLSIVMAGTMDAECLKLMRVIRKKLQFQYHSHYGFNMAIHMAIGFLGLGSGGYTFGKGDLDIAALLISIYPHFPLDLNDNQYHLQALRHLYVLAVKPNLFHSIDIDTGESARVKFKIETDNDIGSAVQKLSQTPILLQGSSHWKSVALLDPDYNSTKFSFDRFTDSFVPRLLFVRKKFSSELNKKALERLIRKRRMVSEDEIKGADLQKLFGNHLFKFFYKVLQKYSRARGRLSEDNLRYLGVAGEQTEADGGSGASEQRESEMYHFDCAELLDVYYSVLENNRPYFIYEYLQFLMIGPHGDFNLFATCRDLFGKELGAVEDIRLLTKFYSRAVRETKTTTLKSYEANIYKIGNELKQKLAFTAHEKAMVKHMVDSLRSKQRLPDVVGKFRRPSEYQRFVTKLKLGEVVLPTVMVKIVNDCRAVREQLCGEGKGRWDRQRLGAIMAENQLVREHGLADLIQTLIEN
jgi:hypothetical protein